MFVLDCSLSIGAENFTKILNLSNAIVEDLVIGPTRTQVGAIVFSGGPHLEFGLSAYSSKEELASAISGLPYFGDDTDTADALYMLVDEGFAEARPPIEGVPQVAILVTDGQSNDAHRTAMAAQKLKRVKSITTYAVGVGDADLEELETIASVRNGEHLVRYISSYDPAELERLQEDLKDVVCTGMFVYIIYQIHKYSCSINSDEKCTCIVDYKLNFFPSAASINAPVEVKPIKRDIEKNTNVYVEFSVPEDGFTIEVEVEIGQVAVCGSNSLERPDCSYSLTYDWRLEVNQYSELYIGANGSPGGSEDTTPAPTTPTDDAITNATVYVTVEGLDTNNTFLLNTTYGDTTTPTTTATVTTEGKLFNIAIMLFRFECLYLLFHLFCSDQHHCCSRSDWHYGCSRHHGCSGSDRHHGCSRSDRHHGCSGSDWHHNCSGSDRHHGCSGSDWHHGCSGSDWHHRCSRSEHHHYCSSGRYLHIHCCRDWWWTIIGVNMCTVHLRGWSGISLQNTQ